MGIFCLCIRPATSTSIWRIQEAIARGCIPVLFDDQPEELPFADLIEWKLVVVLLRATQANNTTAQLRAVPLWKVRQLQAAVHAVQPYFTDQDPLSGDRPRGWALHLVFYELCRIGKALRKSNEYACTSTECMHVELAGKLQKMLEHTHQLRERRKQFWEG